RDRRLEERGRARATRSGLSRAARAPGGDDVRSLQVHRVSTDRALDWQGVRRAVPPSHGPSSRWPSQQRLDRTESLVRAALLPTHTARAGGGGPRPLRVLVTGGSGFIGSHVVDRLRAHGHEPRNFDLVPSAYHRNGELETVIGDLLDVDVLRAALRGCDAVVHLAAVADVNDVVADPARAELVNDRGTSILLEAARAEETPRVVYASTVWVYGDANGFGPVDEDSHLPLPGHLYTATKLAGEMYCTSYAALWGLEHTILRFGIPYGPRARPATVVAAFVARARAGKSLTITGAGTQSRRFVYVEDLADGVVAALAPSAAGRIYNLV